jgi:hypothetical protein
MKRDLELKALMPHCLDVKTKVEQVMTIDAHLGPSLFQVFPLRTVWDVIIADEDPDETVECFEESVRSFVGSHSAAEDQHELLTQLQHPHKPREIKQFNFLGTSKREKSQSTRCSSQFSTICFPENSFVRKQTMSQRHGPMSKSQP